MKQRLSSILSMACALLGGLTAVRCLADQNVTVTAAADSAYTQHKFVSGKTVPETYVMKAGEFAASELANDSLNTTPFRRVAEALASTLAPRGFSPAKTVQDADLLIVVHWGSGAMQRTLPTPVFLVEQFALGTESHNRNQLVVIDRPPPPWPAAVASEMPRTYPSYFVTLAAYDLRADPARRANPVWRLDLNIPTIGNEFGDALRCMSSVAADYVGRSTSEPTHVRAKPGAELAQNTPVLIIDEGDRGAGPAHAGS